MNEDMKHIMEIEKVKKEADRLMINKIEYYEKEMALVREQCQVELLQKDKRISDLVDINVDHQKLNGELREDNKKLAKQIDDYVSKLRTAGLI
jgi:G3E family GTPase